MNAPSDEPERSANDRRLDPEWKAFTEGLQAAFHGAQKSFLSSPAEHFSSLKVDTEHLLQRMLTEKDLYKKKALLVYLVLYIGIPVHLLAERSTALDQKQLEQWWELTRRVRDVKEKLMKLLKDVK